MDRLSGCSAELGRCPASQQAVTTQQGKAEWYMCSEAELPAGTQAVNAIRFFSYGSNYRLMYRGQQANNVKGYTFFSAPDGPTTHGMGVILDQVETTSDLLLIADTVNRGQVQQKTPEGVMEPAPSNLWSPHPGSTVHAVYADGHAAGDTRDHFNEVVWNPVRVFEEDGTVLGP